MKTNDAVASHSKAAARRRGLLMSATIPLAVLTAAPAWAGDDETAVEEVVVTASPIRDSLAKSLQIQREANNIVNVIAADTIGRFPDATAASALARLPGVGVQRDQGQERYIQIRGAPTRWTTVALDGVNVLGAEDRIFRFDSVPAAQISEVILNKTLTPDQPAEALAGRVNIATYSPLDNPGFHAYGDLGGGFVDLGDGPVKQYSGKVSWANDTWGFSLIGSHYSFEQQTDNSEPRFDAVGLTQMRFTKYIIERQTESYSARVEYAPSDNHRFSLTHLKTEFNDFEQRNWYRFQYDKAYSGTRNFQTADLVGVPQDGSFADGVYSNGVWFTVLHGDHKLGGWNLDWDLAYTSTEFNTHYPSVTQQISSGLSAVPSAANTVYLPSMQVQVNAKPGGFPKAMLYDTILVNGVPTRGAYRTSLNQLSLTEEFATESSSQLETKAYTVKADVDREWTSFGADATFRAGFQVDDRSQDSQTVALVRPDGTVVSGNRNGFNLRQVSGELGLPWTPIALVTTNPWDSSHDRGFTATLIDNKTMRKQLDALMAAARAANEAGTGNYAVYDFDPRAANTVDETVAAAYAMNSWDWSRHHLVMGVRVEHTKIDTDGLATVGGSLDPISVSSTFTKVFPSVHYTYDFRDDVKLRAAFISGSARPSLADMRATVSVNDTAQTVSGGNPNLKPETAYGVDLSAEWYFAPDALLAVSAYHREVKDVLFESTEVIDNEDYNFDGMDRRGYLLTSEFNGKSGHLSGVEFVYYQPWSFLPGWLSGFGFQGSVAFTTGEFKTPDGETVKFPGTSDRILGVTLFYEKHGLSTRLTYQHRTDWLDEVFPSGSAANSNLYWDATQRLDLSVRYQVNEQVSFFLDANNLTDETGVRYQGREDRPYEVETFGRKYLAGVRFNF